MTRKKRKYNKNHHRDDLTIMESVSQGHSLGGQIPKNASRGVKHCSDLVDATVCCCCTCGIVYELERFGYKYRMLVYEDFPTIGKNRDECPECRKSKGEETFFTRANRGGAELPWSRYGAIYKEKDVWID